MLLDDFILAVQDEISASCSLPFKIPEQEIMRIIKNDALKWFWKHYEYSMETSYLKIPLDAMQSNEFKCSRKLKLPDCIYSVIRLQEAKGNLDIRGDFSVEKFYLRDVYTNQNFDVEGLTYYVMNSMYFDLVKSILGAEMRYDFNYLTHNLTLLGEIPDKPAVATVLKKIPDEALFDDDYFLEYVVSKSMIQLGRILGTVQMPLIGNATIDFDSFKSDGKERLDALKELIKGEEGADYFFMV